MGGGDFPAALFWYLFTLAPAACVHPVKLQKARVTAATWGYNPGNRRGLSSCAATRYTFYASGAIELDTLSLHDALPISSWIFPLGRLSDEPQGLYPDRASDR